MLKCGLCKRQTEKGEPTAKFLTYVYKDPRDRDKGKRIYSEIKVCMHCKGSCLLK